MNQVKYKSKLLAVVLYLLLANTCAAASDEVQIVAYGASFTYGQGVGMNYAYPARLEALLKSSGENVNIKNRGISGETTLDLKIRLDRAVPDGVQIVIFGFGLGNDKRASMPIETTIQNVEEVVSRLKARNIQVLLILRRGDQKQLRRVTKLFTPIIQKYEISHIAIEQTEDSFLPDRQHPSAAYHAEYAERMFPLVKTLIERVKNQNNPS